MTDFIQRYILSTVSLFQYAFIDDSENRLLPYLDPVGYVSS
jgi:hypothetical protein